MKIGMFTRLLGAQTYLVAALVCLVPCIGLAFTLKSLIMPGGVIEAHANIEEDCDSCHEGTESDSQSELCFVCHTEVRDDLSSSSGFHGRHPEVRDSACSTCHGEHEGRDADITALDIEAFAHVYTDFPLVGAHGDATCETCHTSDTAYRDAPRQCLDCHASSDVHKGTLGSTCSSCHSETAWAQTLFDHASTGFPLTGQHSLAVCSDCHEDQTFVRTPTQCAECHASNDVHSGRNGEQCGSCHNSVAWPVPRFDHAGVTGFALRGSHQKLTCEACHVTNLVAALPATCGGCHQSDDPHQGRLGASCESCHSSNQWQETSFDHSTVADFPLTGAHAELACTTCHESSVDVPLGQQCTSCHGDDPHQGQLGSRCESCHAQTTWLASIRFDHDLIAFPLLGKHAALACTDCHASAAFHDAGAACTDCHGASDVHGGAFGQECATCHNPRDWQAWAFDHDLQAGFPLTGAHSDLTCASCHARPIPEMGAAAEACGQCHRQDDPHAGRFGANCGSCHTTDSFSELQGR
jgi:hypothetical protein